MTQKPTSSRTKILIASGILATVALIYIILPKGESNKQGENSASSFQSTAPKSFHGFTRDGIGGDPLLNDQKNRWTAPTALLQLSVSQIMALPHSELSSMGKEDRKKWTATAIAQADASESHGVQVVGYLAKAKESGSEACNGKSDALHDFHIWITESPGENKNQGIIIEATPYWKEQFPAWTLQAFEKLALNNAKVRILGWLLWDDEHADEVGKSRGSLWEVHPFTKFEVEIGGSWKELGSNSL